jgi:GT2 family glycosyltransferase
MSVRLSVVIPTCERHDLLRTCLASVVQHAPARTEIIVVADGSLGTAVEEFPGVKLVRLPQRRGFCAAANAGIAAAGGDIVELLNDDTEVTTGWAGAALECFSDSKVAAVAPLVFFASRDRERPENSDSLGADTARSPSPIIDSAGDSYDPGGFARKMWHGEPFSSALLGRREVFGASASSAFYRRDMLLRAGSFPPQFGGYFEDVDLSFRLHRAGGLIVFEPASRVLHHGGFSYGPASPRLIRQQSYNEERVWWRNLSSCAIVQTLPRHFVVLGVKAVRRWKEGLLLPWLCGRLAAWAEIGQSRRHQRQLSQLGPAAPLAAWHVAPLPHR